MTSLAGYPRRYCPGCDQMVRRDFLPGPGGRRPDAACPRCRCLERHRFLALLLAMLTPGFGPVGTLLEVSPSPHSTKQLAKLAPRLHMGLDIGYDGRLVDVLGSLTELPYAEGSIDLLVCYHVLEHIPDDRSAMREIARVLAPGGTALLQVPWRPGARTDEDPEADEDERLRRFGQRDHVRYYGDDFEDRMVAAGLTFERVTPLTVLGEAMVTWCKLVPNEPVWIVRRSDDPRGSETRASDSPVDGERVDQAAGEPAARGTSLTLALDAVLGELAETKADLVTARKRVRRLRDDASGVLSDEDDRAAASQSPAGGDPAGGAVQAVTRRIRGAARRRQD